MRWDEFQLKEENEMKKMQEEEEEAAAPERRLQRWEPAHYQQKCHKNVY